MKLSREVISRVERPIKVVQFGEGNFLRAFVDWIIFAMNTQGIYNGAVAVVQPLPNGRVQELADQDGLYTLFMQGQSQGQAVRKKEVIDVLQQFVNPYTNYQEFLQLAENPDLDIIISNTTEAGIIFDPNDMDLTVCPNSFPAKLLALLYHRYQFFQGDNQKGLHIIPCELIDYNGDQLKNVLLQLGNALNLDFDFINWLKSANCFHNTLVDRIVPGYPRQEAEAIMKELGYVDNNLVTAEIFHLWVIEADQRLSAIFPADQAGLEVLYVKDFKPYKERKVKILNGAHTALTPIAYLGGIDTVREALLNPTIERYVKQYIEKEVTPTLDLPKAEIEKFAESVISRFLNPFIRHEVISISLNSTTKYTTRILPVLLDYYRINNALPPRAVFALAALAVFYRGQRGAEVIPLKDNPEYLKMWAEIWQESDYKKVATTLLGQQELFGLDLNSLPGLTQMLAEFMKAICLKGTLEAVQLVL